MSIGESVDFQRRRSIRDNIMQKVSNSTAGVRLSRRPAISATTKSATRVDQLGDNLFPAFHYIFSLKLIR